MKLLAKFNILLVVIFSVGAFLIAEVAYSFLVSNARREVLDQAELMMASAKSVRDYTAAHVRPLLQDTQLHKEEFLPETVPAFGATTTFSSMRKQYPEYTYREPTLNPTNLQDRASDWESDIINYLRDNANEKELKGERETPTGRALYLARPLRAEIGCMPCHSVPEAAPASMIKRYGANNGFGWKLNDVVAAQVVSVPMSVPVQIANQAFRRLLIFMIVGLLATIFALDVAVYVLVIRPLNLVSETADRVSKGETDLPELPVKGSDEISNVTASFNRMQTSLVKALNMLEQ